MAEAIPGHEGGTTTGPKSRARLVVEWATIIVGALVVAFVVKTFLVQAFYIPSGSMEPTLFPGDRVLVDKLSFDLHSVHRGDVVVFHKPADDDDRDVTDLIKRVIGLPGQTISSGPDGSILIDGRPIAQPWLETTATLNPFDDPGPRITNQPRRDSMTAPTRASCSRSASSRPVTST